jgi:hypothetical protein
MAAPPLGARISINPRPRETDATHAGRTTLCVPEVPLGLGWRECVIALLGPRNGGRSSPQLLSDRSVPVVPFFFIFFFFFTSSSHVACGMSRGTVLGHDAQLWIIAPLRVRCHSERCGPIPRNDEPKLGLPGALGTQAARPKQIKAQSPSREHAKGSLILLTGHPVASVTHFHGAAVLWAFIRRLVLLPLLCCLTAATIPT